MRTEPAHIVVVGGGLAGLSAGIACADGGSKVTLFEGRPRLGGATWSFERNGLVFDNGQHVFLRCCAAYRRFLGRLGTADRAVLQHRLAVPVLRPDTQGGEPQVAWLRRSGLPAPAHLVGSLVRYRHLSLAERARVGRAVSALRRLSLDDSRSRLGDVRVVPLPSGAVARRHRQALGAHHASDRQPQRSRNVT